VLRRRDEAEGSEASAVVGLSPSAVVGRPLRADPSGRLLPGDPVLLRIGAGRIVDVTPLAARDAVWDEPGGTLGDDQAVLLPAFADAHIHLMACAAGRAGVDLALEHPPTLATLLAHLAASAEAVSGAVWLRASGYDEAWLAERRHPLRMELDAAVARRPLRLRHATRHASLLNSLAFARVEQALGRLGEEHAPRDAAGTPLGIVYGLEPEITQVVGPLAEATLRAALRCVGNELARLGVVHLDEVTASNDAGRVARLATAVADGDLPQQLRVFVGDPDEAEPARRAAGGRVEIAGVKLLARSTEEVCAPGFLDTLVRARRRGLPVAVHAVEADVIAGVLAALEAAPPRHGGDVRVPDRLEHCSLCPPELVRRVAEAGVAVVTQPAFLAVRGAKYRAEVEPPLWPWLYPLRALRAAGVLVAGGSDAPVVPFDPRLGLDGATRRRAGDEMPLAPEEALDDAAALELFSVSAARLRGARVAGLTAGAAADVLLAEPGSLRRGWRSLQVRRVLSAGRVIA